MQKRYETKEELLTRARSVAETCEALIRLDLGIGARYTLVYAVLGSLERAIEKVESNAPHNIIDNPLSLLPGLIDQVETFYALASAQANEIRLHTSPTA